MEGSLNNMSKLNIGKDVFKQRGGTLGLILLAAGLVVFAMNVPAILLWVNSLARLLLVGGGIAAGLFVVSDKKTRMAASTMYMLAIRKIIGLIIKTNPIAILEDAIVKMKKKINQMEEKMGILNGIRLDLKEKIKEKKQMLKDCLDRMKIAERQGKKDLMILENRQSVRLTELCQSYIDLSISSEKWYETMSKIADMAKLTVMDAENEVVIQKEKYEAVKMSHSAFKSAMSVIKGDPDELAMYNQAFQYVHDDIMNKLGEMDRVINSAGGIIDNIDVEKEIFTVKGSELLKKYEDMGIDSLFNKFENKPNLNELIKSSTISEVKSSSYSGSATATQTEQKSKYF